jgi:hypothetical protein
LFLARTKSLPTCESTEYSVLPDGCAHAVVWNVRLQLQNGIALSLINTAGGYRLFLQLSSMVRWVRQWARFKRPVIFCWFTGREHRTPIKVSDSGSSSKRFSGGGWSPQLKIWVSLRCFG